MKRLMILSLAFLAIPFAPLAAPAQEKQPQVIMAWGTVIDPDGDCKIGSKDGKLTITVPGTVHDLSAYNPKQNAPRVLQEIEGDFSIEVRVSGEFDPGDKAAIEGRNAFNGAGLLLMQDGKNYLRLERNVWVTPAGVSYCYTPLLEHWKNSEQLNEQDVVDAKETPYFMGRSTHLRLIRRGGKVLVELSHDGDKWTEIKELAVELPKKIQVGVMAINTSKKPLVVEFDRLKLSRP